jgi:predicted Zn-dependent protease
MPWKAVSAKPETTAESHFMRPHITGTGITEAMSGMENLANRILRIDNTPSHCYLYLSIAMYKKPWGYRKAGKLLKKACELDPTNVTAQLMRANLAIEGGYPETALACSDTIAKLDPLSPVGWMNRCVISTLLGEFEEAPPDNFVQMGLLYDSALKQKEDEFKDIIFPEFTAAAEWDETFSWILAQCHACVGNVEESIYWLKKAMERCFINYPFLSEIEPFIGKIRDDKRVRELLLEIKQEWEKFEI